MCMRFLIILHFPKIICKSIYLVELQSKGYFFIIIFRPYFPRLGLFWPTTIIDGSNNAIAEVRRSCLVSLGKKPRVLNFHLKVTIIFQKADRGEHFINQYLHTGKNELGDNFQIP